MSDYATIAYDDSRAPVAWITLSQPERRNPISPLTCGELLHAFERAGADREIRAVVLTGAGVVFSAGGDLGAFLGRGGATESVAKPASLVQLLPAMHELGTPIVCAVNGHALAGGLGLMVACDLVIASSAATFGTTEIKVGLWPMMITAVLQRVMPHKAALELMMTGRRMAADEALRLGVVSRVVQREELDDVVDLVVDGLASMSSVVMRMGRDAFYAVEDMPFDAALEHLHGGLTAVASTEDAAEGVAAFLDKRKPRWRGR